MPRVLLTWLLAVPYPWRDPETVQDLFIDYLVPLGPFAPPVPYDPPVPQTFGRLYLPDAGQDDVPKLHLNDDDSERGWQSWVRPVPQTFGPLYLPDATHDVPRLYLPTEDEWWFSWVAPVPQLLGPLYAPDRDAEDVPRLYTTTDEDGVWINWVAPRSQVFLPIYLPDADVLKATVATVDDDIPSFAFTSTVQTRWVISPWASDESAPQPVADESETWQNWVPAVPAQNQVWLPWPTDEPSPQPAFDDDVVWAVSGSLVQIRLVLSPWASDESALQPIADDDTLWVGPLLTSAAIPQPTLERDEFAPGAAAVVGDEDSVWSVPVPIASAPSVQLGWATDDLTQQPTLGIDDDLGPTFVSTVVVRLIVSPWASDESAPQPVADESETWQNWVAAVPAQNLVQLPLSEAASGDYPAPALGVDEDYWQNWVPAIAARNLVWLPAIDDLVIAPVTPLGVDEDLGPTFGSTVLVRLVVSPWASDESAPPVAVPDEDAFWQNWVAPVQADANVIAVRPPWFGGWTEDIFAQLQEDFLVYFVLDDNLPGPLYRPDADEQILSIPAISDEDQSLGPILYQLNLRPFVYQPPQQAFTDTDEIPPVLLIDDLYPYFALPFPANQPLGVPAYVGILRAGDESQQWVPQPGGAKDDDFLVLHIGPRLELTLRGKLKFRVN